MTGNDMPFLWNSYLSAFSKFIFWQKLSKTQIIIEANNFVLLLTNFITLNNATTMLKKLLTISFLLCFLSCGESFDFDAADLIGNWKTASWMENHSNKKIPNQMDFTFQQDSLYEIDYGSLKEKGKYWIAGEYLHTIEDGQAEKKVRLIMVKRDSVIFEMNRTGKLETVILTKK